jgi:hypothetical protein
MSGSGGTLWPQHKGNRPKWHWYHDDSRFFIERVLHDEGRHNADPQLGRLENQVTKRLTKLRIDVKTLVDGFGGGKNLGRQPQGRRFLNQLAQLIADALGIGDVVRHGLA